MRMCRPAWCLEASLPSTNANSLPGTCRTCWPEPYIPEAHLSGRTCGVSTLARPAKLIIRLSTQDWHAGLTQD